MTSGILFALAIAALSVAVIVGLVRRSRGEGPATRTGIDSPNTVAQWTEGGQPARIRGRDGGVRHAWEASW